MMDAIADSAWFCKWFGISAEQQNEPITKGADLLELEAPGQHRLCLTSGGSASCTRQMFEKNPTENVRSTCKLSTRARLLPILVRDHDTQVQDLRSAADYLQSPAAELLGPLLGRQRKQSPGPFPCTVRTGAKYPRLEPLRVAAALLGASAAETNSALFQKKTEAQDLKRMARASR